MRTPTEIEDLCNFILKARALPPNNYLFPDILHQGFLADTLPYTYPVNFTITFGLA
jgi:hypothetical protein